MARMKDIAERLGISVNAVSIALNNKPGVSGELRHRVLHAAQEMGYLPKKERFLQTYARSNLCVMMQRRYSSDMDFYGRVLVAVSEEAKSHGYEVLIHFFEDTAMAVPDCILSHQVTGIVVIGMMDDRNLLQLMTYGIPIVLADYTSLKAPVDSVISDSKRGGFIATEYLLERGHKTVGFFGDLGYSLNFKDRYFGYREALLRSGVADVDAYVKQYSVIEEIEQAIVSNDAAFIEKLLRSRPGLPEGFVCSNDRAAVLLITCLNRLGYRVPDDVSVVGFDDIDICDAVGLTTVRVNKKEMGKQAVLRLLQISGHRDSVPQNKVLSVRLVERTSVK